MESRKPHAHDANSIPSPYHQLMSEKTKQKNLNQWKPLGRNAERDWLSKRQQVMTTLCRLKEHEAWKNAPEAVRTVPPTSAEESPDEKLWSGASTVERALISCCTLGEAQAGADLEPEDDSDEDAWLVGALRESQMLKFVGVMAMDCQDLASRSLVLAILERTHELDEKMNQNYDLVKRELSFQSLGASGSKPKIEDAPPPMKRLRIHDNRTTTVPSSLVVVTPKPPPPRRLMKFLAAQGLKILSRWLVEASEPVIVEVANSEKNKFQPQVRPSPTGLLLLPLLEFLQNIPLNKHLITQSKINKVIKKLSKHVDSLVSHAQSEGKVKLQQWTHADVGGCSLIEVQTALNKVKSSWETKAKEISKADNDSMIFDDPLGRLHSLLKDRLEDLKNVDSGEVDKPAWLLNAAKEEEKATPAHVNNNSATHFRSATTDEKARKERENERHDLMKEDLEKARQERLKLLKKLREMKKANDTIDEVRPLSRRTVKWKDGLPASSKQRRRDVLESVFVFDREHATLIKYQTEPIDDNQESP